MELDTIDNLSEVEGDTVVDHSEGPSDTTDADGDSETDAENGCVTAVTAGEDSDDSTGEDVEASDVS